MEIKTCEQYVLAELEDAQDRIIYLLDELDNVKRENEKLREQLVPDEIDQIIMREGREHLFDRCSAPYIHSAIDENGPVPFVDWCIDCTLPFHFPKGLSKSKFIEVFEPEFRAAYEERIAEEEE